MPFVRISRVLTQHAAAVHSAEVHVIRQLSSFLCHLGRRVLVAWIVMGDVAIVVTKKHVCLESSSRCRDGDHSPGTCALV
jgi:hypothetical protein